MVRCSFFTFILTAAHRLLVRPFISTEGWWRSAHYGQPSDEQDIGTVTELIYIFPTSHILSSTPCKTEQALPVHRTFLRHRDPIMIRETSRWINAELDLSKPIR